MEERVDDLRIRPATLDDIPCLRAIDVAAGSLFADVGMDEIAAGQPPSTVVLAGFVHRGSAWVTTGPDDGPVAYRLDAMVDGEWHLEQVSVDPAWSRRGVGRRLIDGLVERARCDRRPSVTLTTFVDVAWNAPYYARLGFRILDSDELGPGLRAIRRTEIARGLDRWPRCAMRRDV